MVPRSLPSDRKPTPPPRVLTIIGRTLDGKAQSYLKASVTFPQSITRPVSHLLNSHLALVELRGTLHHKLRAQILRRLGLSPHLPGRAVVLHNFIEQDFLCSCAIEVTPVSESGWAALAVA